MTKMMTTQKQIMMICDGMKELLLEKNKRYGDAAIHPRKVFYIKSTRIIPPFRVEYELL